jgi:hypothetical protein
MGNGIDSLMKNICHGVKLVLKENNTWLNS